MAGSTRRSGSTSQSVTAQNEAAHRVAEGHTLDLHVQPQQAGAPQQADGTVEQKRNDLVQHGCSVQP
jgi:hypothetical protein